MTANPVAAAIARTRFLLEELAAIALSTPRRLDALEDGVRQDPMGFQAVVYGPWMTIEPPEGAGGGLDYPAAEAPRATPERDGRAVCQACAAAHDLMEEGA